MCRFCDYFFIFIAVFRKRREIHMKKSPYARFNMKHIPKILNTILPSGLGLWLGLCRPKMCQINLKYTIQWCAGCGSVNFSTMFIHLVVWLWNFAMLTLKQNKIKQWMSTYFIRFSGNGKFHLIRVRSKVVKALQRAQRVNQAVKIRAVLLCNRYRHS